MILTCPPLTPQLFLEVGNGNANSFWAANLPLEEELYSGASAEQRATFVRRKYRERKYRKVLEGFHDLEQLNQVHTSSGHVLRSQNARNRCYRNFLLHLLSCQQLGSHSHSQKASLL